MSITLMVVLALVALVVLTALALLATGVKIYNQLVTTRLESENAWSQIDVQLQRRNDLILNLVETVKGYAGHERQTLEAVIKARQQTLDVRSIQDKALAENVLAGAMRQLMVVSEAYPELKANENFKALQDEIAGTENRISFTRQYYNDSVRRYNQNLAVFPANFVAGMFQFKAREFFEVQNAQERAAPQVRF